MTPPKPDFVERTKEIFFRPAAGVTIAWIRFVVYGTLIWKLLSRDFSVFGFAPDFLLNFYPDEQYSLFHGYTALGFKPIVDLATFHWVHWFIELPSPAALEIVQIISIVLCAAVILFGRGPRNALAISTLVTIAYLWGFVWRTGSEIDSIFIQYQIAILYCFFREDEAMCLRRKRIPPATRTPQNGAFFSLVIMVFCWYYVQAGINKIIDVSPAAWFQFDLVNVIVNFRDMADSGYYLHTGLPLADYLEGSSWLSMIAVPIAYAVELSMPLMFYRRRLIPLYACFWVTFHIALMSIACAFIGSLTAWLVFVPVHLLARPATPPVAETQAAPVTSA